MVAADDAQIIAYDSTGRVVGSLAVWQDSRGRLHFSADYGDGSAHVIIDGDRVHYEGDLDPATLALRGATIAGYLGPDDAQAGWIGCAATAGVAIVGAVTANPATPFLGVIAACHCLPLIPDKEFQALKCFD